jgi:hypothetical protein
MAFDRRIGGGDANREEDDSRNSWMPAGFIQVTSVVGSIHAETNGGAQQRPSFQPRMEFCEAFIMPMHAISKFPDDARCFCTATQRPGINIIYYIDKTRRIA